MDNRNILSVGDTFQEKTVLLTGATGFLGKLALEKLLRSCPKIKKIYIIVRTKKGKDANQRKNELLESKMFGPLKGTTVEKLEEKIEVIPGDLALPNLDISPIDKKKLLEETNFVFHFAATVRFNENIRTAVAINIKGTRDILKLAKQMKRLQGFVHVSTAYSFSPRTEIDEIFYDPPYEVDNIINAVDSMDDDLLEFLTPKMFKDWPNTYTLTKSIAEHVIKTESDGLPVCIVRPSIVLSTYQEPLSGWNDNVFGPVGTYVAAALGLLKTMWMKPNKIADVVPADFVINCVISAGWDVSNNREATMGPESKGNKIKIYNFVSGPENPISWGQICKHTMDIGETVPSKACLWYYCFIPSPCEEIYKIYRIFLHMIPAYIIDFIAKHTGRKPQLVKIYKKLHSFCGVLGYFNTHEWKFSNENTKELWKKMIDEDRAVFPFSMKLISWRDYFAAMVTGIRVHIFKDPLDTLEEGKAHYRKLKFLHYSTVTFVFVLFLVVLYFFFKILFNILF